ncbi:hypothetical protein LTR62_005708 [Meristemomyces frigidus]|uniref:Structure-specific endonuclease subunit SLX4 n=1 Tax=Meristemomyces frigidus TaxID=1508187 RepID=A0AAN7TGL2_9PEZI|nr:hypothetical protein LTR62_005708 [Meristemomyces frigidus]
MELADSPRKPLGELIGNLKYTATAEKRSISGDSTTKRRRIELADPSTTSAVPKKLKNTAKVQAEAPRPRERAKKPAKKPRTITEAATAAYQLPEVVDVPDNSVSKFFVQEKVADREPETGKKPRKSRAKLSTEEGSETTTPIVKRARKKKVTVEKPEPPLLYTPRKASEQAESQCFFFGTSSQIVLPESPTFIKQIQIATEESEAMSQAQKQPTGSPRGRSYLKVPTAPHGTSLSVGQAEREHWCASARDWKGGLLRESSGLMTKKKAPKPLTKTVSAPVAQPKQMPSGFPVVGTGPNVLEKTTPARGVPATIVILSSSSVVRSPNKAPKTTSVKHDSPLELPSESYIDIDDIPDETTMNTMPEKVAEAIAPASDSFMDIDDISDHDLPPTPSPPRRRASAPTSPVQPLAFSRPVTARVPQIEEQTTDVSITKPSYLSTTAALKATDPQWPDIRELLFPQITHQIKTAKRSSDPRNPSWNQKILLYDPIVLEDITPWLNEQNLRISVRRMKAKEKTKPGRKKKKRQEPEEELLLVGSEQEFEMVKEDVQPWMVQKWCEEKSICCLWKEGLRGGVKTRY